MAVGNRAGRWSKIERLLQLGWSVNLVAKVAGFAPSVIHSDIRHHGGMKDLFPDRPGKKKQIYAGTFFYYAQQLEKSEQFPLKEEIEELLQIAQIQAAEESMIRTYEALCKDRCNGYIESYVKLSHKLLRVSPPPRMENRFLRTYIQLVGKRKRYSPGSYEEVVRDIENDFVAVCDKGFIKRPLQAMELRQFIDNWLARESDLSHDEQTVLIHRFGLRGQQKQTLDQIRIYLRGVSRERVRQVEVKALKKLRRSQDHIETLRIFFFTLAELEARTQTYVQKLHLLETQMAQLVRQKEELLSCIKDGAFSVILEKGNDEWDPWKDKIDLLSKSCDYLQLSVRASNCLQKAHIQRIGQLIQLSDVDLLKLKHFGRRSLRDVTERLADHDLILGVHLSEDLRKRFALSAQTLVLIRP